MEISSSFSTDTGSTYRPQGDGVLCACGWQVLLGRVLRVMSVHYFFNTQIIFTQMFRPRIR